MEEKKEIGLPIEETMAEFCRPMLFKRFGPANKRTKFVWQNMIKAFGFEIIRDAEGLTDDQLNKKSGSTSYSKQLDERFKQKRLNG